MKTALKYLKYAIVNPIAFFGYALMTPKQWVAYLFVIAFTFGVVKELMLSQYESWVGYVLITIAWGVQVAHHIKYFYKTENFE